MAYDFDGSTDLDVFARYSRFLARDVEAGLEGGLWHFNQDGENPLGLSAAVLFRWHFIHQPDWTAFMDGGIGVLGASDNVPAGGTGFDLMPRIGIGFTRRLTDAGLRLEGGLRWHHISNARLQGDDENPSRDGPMLYAGVTMPF